MTENLSPRLGIDLGGTKIEGILLSPGNEITERRRVPTPGNNYEAILDAIRQLVDTLDPSGSLPVGIGAPGSVSRVSPLMRNANSTCLNGQPLHTDLESRLKRPVRLANDADCFTLSEASDGAAAGSGSVFGVILGTGVGGGLLLNGALLQGINGIAGEWGHNPVAGPVQPRGRDCFCGRQDCVETWLSGPGLARSYEQQSGRLLSTQEIVDRMHQGERAAARTIDNYLEVLAASLAGVINLVDPEVVVLGGGLSNIDEVFEALPGRLPPHVFSDHVATRVVRARHGDSSGVRGAAWLWP